MFLNTARYIDRWLRAFGVNTRTGLKAMRFLPHALKDFWHLRGVNSASWPLSFTYPCLGDFEDSAGHTDQHYFHQDLYVARQVFTRNPVKHIDIGSRIDGFVAHVATFRPIIVIDIRPLPNTIENVTFVQADLSRPLLHSPTADSVSCLHALEHFGLGRYGDPIRHDGWRTGLTQIAAIVASGGVFYLSVPIGRQRIEFNAHRIFNPATIIAAAAEERLTLKEFSYISDRGTVHVDPYSPAEFERLGPTLEYGLGIFVFLKDI
jgi:hypothetical protein